MLNTLRTDHAPTLFATWCASRIPRVPPPLQVQRKGRGSRMAVSRILMILARTCRGLRTLPVHSMDRRGREFSGRPSLSPAARTLSRFPPLSSSLPPRRLLGDGRSFYRLSVGDGSLHKGSRQR